MATVTASRSDLFPVGTSVGVYPDDAGKPQMPPAGTAIASGTVDAAGNVSITNAGILSLVRYVLYANVGGEHRYVRVRSMLDKHDAGTATATGDTTNNSTALANVSASAGSVAVGQTVTGAGIPGGTYLVSGSGASWVMSAKATATASGVALAFYGARAPVAVLGATLVPQRAGTTWQSQLRQRRSIAGTS
jgi:hypothetical protein